MTPSELADSLDLFGSSSSIVRERMGEAQHRMRCAAEELRRQARRIEELEGEWGRHEEAHVVYIDGCRYCESYAEGMRRSVKAQQASASCPRDLPQSVLDAIGRRGPEIKREGNRRPHPCMYCTKPASEGEEKR